MIVTYDSNHVSEAIARLLEQYKNQPHIQGLLTAFVQQIQDLEDSVYPLDHGRQLFDGSTYPSVGAQLDGIGQLVNLSRNGVDDATYLLFILGTIAENFSDDTLPTLINIFQTIFQPTGLLSYEFYPAEVGFAVSSIGIAESLLSEAVNILKNSIGGGIGLGFITEYDPTNAFRYCYLTGTPASLTFSSVPTTGSFVLNFGSNPTASIAYNASASTIQSDIRAISGLSLVTVTGDFAGGFIIDWGVGAQVPISQVSSSLDADINIFNSVIISPGTGGGWGDSGNPSSGGLMSSTLYTTTDA